MRPPRDALLLAALAGLLLLVGLGGVALTDRDEGANAEAAREMLAERSWITPTLGGAPRFAKPAFVYWLTAGAYAVLGATETAARLPSAVAALLLVLVQHAFARWAFGRDVAWRAGLVLLLSVEFVAIGRMALTDATLALWTTIAGYAFMRGWWGAPPRGRWYALAWIAAGLAALAKGPVGLLIPLGGILLYLLLAGGLRQAWREAWPLRGLALFLVVAAPWYAAMFWIHGWDYAARARGETIGRVLRPVTGPGGTFLFYVPVLLLGFFPWSAFLPEALVAALRQARARARRSRSDAVTVFAAAWLLAGIALFSVAQTRLPHYVLPLFPAAALLVAASWPAPPLAARARSSRRNGPRRGDRAGRRVARLRPLRASRGSRVSRGAGDQPAGERPGRRRSDRGRRRGGAPPGRRPPVHDARGAERGRPRHRLPDLAARIRRGIRRRQRASSRAARRAPRARATPSPRSARTGRASSSTRDGR